MDEICGYKSFKSLEQEFIEQVETEIKNVKNTALISLLKEIVIDYQSDAGEELIQIINDLVWKNNIKFKDIVDILQILRKIRYEYEINIEIYNRLEVEILDLFTVYLKCK